MKKLLFIFVLATLAFMPVFSSLGLPAGYVSVYSLLHESESAPLSVDASASRQIFGPANGWGTNTNYNLTNYELIELKITFNVADAGKQVALRFSINGAVYAAYFTYPSTGTSFIAQVPISRYANAQGQIFSGGMVFYNGSTHFGLTSTSYNTAANRAANACTIDYVALKTTTMPAGYVSIYSLNYNMDGTNIALSSTTTFPSALVPAVFSSNGNSLLGDQWNWNRGTKYLDLSQFSELAVGVEFNPSDIGKTFEFRYAFSTNIGSVANNSVITNRTYTISQTNDVIVINLLTDAADIDKLKRLGAIKTRNTTSGDVTFKVNYVAVKMMKTQVNAGMVNISDLSLHPTIDIEVQPQSVLTINQANVAFNQLKVKPGAGLTIANNGSFTGQVVLENNTNGTTATVIDSYTEPTLNLQLKQHVVAGRNWYLSTPVHAVSHTALNRGNRVVAWDESTKAWVDVNAGNLISGKGYIQVSNSSQGTTGDLNFNGLTHSGNVSVPITRTESGSSRGFNLMGNPYPSYLNWNSVVAHEQNQNVEPNMWFRTQNAAGNYVFATYNANGESVSNGAVASITSRIPPMQAFWVKLKPNTGGTSYTSNMLFTNDMRSHIDVSTNALKSPKLNTRSKLRLQITDGARADELLLYMDENATDNYDEYDSPKMFDANAACEIYTVAGEEKLVINGLKSFYSDRVVPLAYSSSKSAQLSIIASELNNKSGHAEIVLVDNFLGIEQVLDVDTKYDFYTDATKDKGDRFHIEWRLSKVSTRFSNNDFLVKVYSRNQNIIIYSDKVSDYKVYNSLGQLLFVGQTQIGENVIRILEKGAFCLVEIDGFTKRVIVR